MKIFELIAKALVIFSIVGCASFKEVSSEEYRTKISRTALKYVGDTKIMYQGKYYDFDCSGFVRFVILSSTGIDIDKSLPFFTTSKTIDYYNFFKSLGAIKKYGSVKPGDLIFFDNTYDRNSNKKLDDRLTHIGIVIGIDKNTDSIVFADKSKGKPVTLKMINLSKPNTHKITINGIDYEINSYVRDDKYYKFLSSQVFMGFGDISVINFSN